MARSADVHARHELAASCTYCNEYDKDSAPVATAEMLRRIDKLAELGTSIITFSGGEPTLHPDLDLLIRRVPERGAMGGRAGDSLILHFTLGASTGTEQTGTWSNLRANRPKEMSETRSLVCC